jgi:pimeloyl-ACP methyl ester carboxylesterase
MTGNVGRFRTPAARERFFELYDQAVVELWPVASEELDVATSFGSTRVRRSGAGNGCPIVLVPGNSGTSVGWFTLVAPLAQDYQVLAVDVMGALGRSVQTRPLKGTADLAVWFRELLDGLGVACAHLIGYSEGGFVAFQAALGNSDVLASVVAIDAGGTVERIRLRFLASVAWTIVKVAVRGPDAMREFGQRLTPGVELPELQWDLMTTGARGFRQALPMPKKMPDEQLRRLSTPTLLYMAADSEVYDARKAARRARALMPDVEIVIVEGAQHGLPLTHPERTWEDIRQFIVRHEPGGRAP